jgi:NAD dependent epimerase/dehydratase family enzyme
MRVVIAGGSGLIGRALTRSLLADGHAVVVLTRDVVQSRSRLPAGAAAVAWDQQPGGAWEAALDGADAVVNLAGESVAGLP